METVKLFYQDSHLKTFTAKVLSCAETEKGYQVVLDATAFYPEGGGQACDLGTLDEAKVQDVREKEGVILHLCDKPLEVGACVSGAIDWQRRFALMQQHSGEHIVSGIVHSMFGWHNVGFHMGSQLMTIDFDGPISAEDLVQIEQKANEAVWANLPVRTWYPAPEELPQVSYRSKKALPWPVRIVQIPGIDSCACCGTHVKMTGEIGLIKLVSCIKFHAGVRIEMACGGKALALTQAVFDQNRAVSQAFSAKMLETGAAAAKMNKALAAEKYRTTGLQRRLFEAIAESYRGIVCPLHFEEALPGSALRELAEKIEKVCGGAIVCAGADESGYTVCITGEDARGLGTRAAKALNGRGGGNPNAYQGFFRANRLQIESFFEGE